MQNPPLWSPLRPLVMAAALTATTLLALPLQAQDAEDAGPDAPEEVGPEDADPMDADEPDADEPDADEPDVEEDTPPDEPDVDEPDAPPTPEGGLTGHYFDNTDFTAFVLERVDPVVEFEWAQEPPDPRMGLNNFAVRWEGLVTPRYTELYTFHTISDDGVRLWVDGRLLVDNWTNHGRTENVGTISLRAGQPAELRLEYYQGGGGAVINLLWSSPGQPRELIPAEAMDPETDLGARRPEVSLVATDAVASEGSGDTARVLVWRWGSVEEALTVTLALGGDVDPENDLEPVQTEVTFPAGISALSVELVTRDDDQREGEETLEVSVAPGPGYTPDPEGVAEIRVNDDEIPPPSPAYSITGTVTWRGEASRIVVLAARDEALEDEVARRVLIEPGLYALSNLDPGSYFVGAFLDLDGDGQRGEGEAQVRFEVEGEVAAVALPPDGFNVDLVFPDPQAAAAKKKDEGCGCATPARAPEGPWGPGLLLALALLGAQARRRRR